MNKPQPVTRELRDVSADLDVPGGRASVTIASISVTGSDADVRAALAAFGKLVSGTTDRPEDS